MAYQIKCDGNVIYDLRDDDLAVLSPRCRLAANAAGEASFTILPDHPYYARLYKLSSVFEIKHDGETIFRGRMTDDGSDFDNKKKVELEGALAYFNDSVVRPFSFPEDFLDYAEYQEAATSGNVVRFFLGWLIDQHNSQVSSFQQFKLGNVTVSDPNNYIYRSDSTYPNTLDALKTKLWDSSLGGRICVRYEDDGNYIDYLSEYDQTNSQSIVFGENLLDLSIENDSTETYSAIIPLGGEVPVKGENGEFGGTVTSDDIEATEQLTLKHLPDGDVSSDIVKVGDVLYSRNAVFNFGWIFAPVSETTWDDVTKAGNLLSNGVDFLNKNRGFLKTVTINAFDLHLTDSEIEAFRVNKNVVVKSKPHNQESTMGGIIYPLSEIDIDMENPQNTRITVGATRRVLTDVTIDMARQVQGIKREYVKSQSVLNGLGNRMTVAESSITQTSEEIAMKVSKNEFDELGNRLTAAESSITMTAEEIAMKVSRDDFNELGNRVSAAESSITQTAEEIALKVSKEEFNDLGNRVSAAESSITQTAEEIALKVSKGEFDDLGNRVTAAESSITQTAEEIALKVSKEEFDSLGKRMEAAESSITQTAEEIALKVSKEEFNSLGDRVTAAESSITQTAEEIALKVSKEEFNSLGDRVTAAESSITQTAEEIALRVSQENCNDLEGRMTAELTLKVGKDDNDQIVSMLNASADVIELKSNRLSIESDNFTLSNDGIVSAQGIDLKNGNLDFGFESGNHIMLGKQYADFQVCDDDFYNSRSEIMGMARYGQAVSITPHNIHYYSDGARCTPISFSRDGFDENGNRAFSHKLKGLWTSDGDFEVIGNLNVSKNIDGIGNVDVEGNLYVGGNFDGPTISDRNKKNSIEPQAEVYSRVFDRLKPVTFKYNHGESDRIHTGFIAQDVEDAIVAEGLTTKDFAAVCYDTDEQGNKSNYRIRYDEIISMCVKEIQDLKCRLSECERRIAEYEGRA
jgi:hypothetical protein